jgi:plastocyanin domain-containing protein
MVIAISIIVVVTMAAVILLTGLYLRGSRPVRARSGPDGFQEARIIIDGGYHPDHICVTLGIPVRLHIWRGEDNPCSQRILFSGIGVERRLPSFQETVIEFLPPAAGTFLFTCQWGIYRGKLVVVPPRGRLPAAAGPIKG